MRSRRRLPHRSSTSATPVVRQAHLLDRHWRNIRTLASHNPTSYKAQAIGAYHVRGTRLSGSGYF